jgi:hypothetical protein
VTDGDHYRNFIDCIKGRQRPAADIEIAHKALSITQLASFGSNEDTVIDRIRDLLPGYRSCRA